MATTSVLVGHAHRQVVGFAVATVGWMFAMICMGLAEWRRWYMDLATPQLPGLACIGMWRVCIYHYGGRAGDNVDCHMYTYEDTYLPLDIRVAQSLLLAASVLGLLSRVLTVGALRNVYVGSPQQNAAWPLFAAAGTLNIMAGACLSITALWNYISVWKAEGIAFPPSFTLPFRPDVQEVGGAFFRALLAAFLMALGGLLLLSYWPLQGLRVRLAVSAL